MLSTSSYYLLAVAVALKIYLSSSRKKNPALCKQNYLYEISVTYT